MSRTTFWLCSPSPSIASIIGVLLPSTYNPNLCSDEGARRVSEAEVVVDVGYKSEGVIPVSELSIRRSINPDDEVGVGALCGGQQP